MAKLGQKTKHPPSFYLDMGSRGTLSIASPMVIFTDSPEEVRLARQKPELTLIVECKLEEFQAYQLHFERMQELFTRDEEGMTNGYSPLLFTVYHAKPELMTRAIQLDAFKTDKFLYMDVGAIRDWGGIHAEHYIDRQFPSPDREWLIGRQDRVQLQGTAGRESACEESVRWVEAERADKVLAVPRARKVKDAILVKQTPVHWWIAGSIFGGNKKSLVEYSRLYSLELKRYLAADLPEYALIDQYLMGALACKYDVVEVVRPPLPCCVERVNRMWFFMLMFLKDETYPQAPYTAEELVERNMTAPASV